MICSSCAIDRGVNARDTMCRMAVCSGGSWLRIITRCSSSEARSMPSGNRMIAPFSAFEKRLLSFDTAATSAWPVTAQ